MKIESNSNSVREKICHHHHWSLEHILFQDLFVQNAVNNLNNADADSADADVVCLVGLLMILPRLLHHLNFNVSYMQQMQSIFEAALCKKHQQVG